MSSLPQRVTQPAEPAGPALRLSDREREQAVALLNEAVADGRLTWPEHAERVERVWGARTADDLAPCVADLGSPVRHVGFTGAPVVATFSKIVRRPELDQPIQARSRFGAVFLDLTDAQPGAVVFVEATSFCGKVVLTVGPGATVIDEGDAVLAKRKILAGPGSADGPVIRITGRSTLGHLKVFGSDHRGW
jgi:hypothetical protein